MGRYLNHDKLAASGNTGTLRVRCFYNGLYYVCPDPKDRKLVREIAIAYSQGYFLEYYYVKITEEYYADRSNWS